MIKVKIKEDNFCNNVLNGFEGGNFAGVGGDWGLDESVCHIWGML